VIGEGVRIEDGATIKSFCYMQFSRIGEGATVGPFARLRPGADLANDAHVGEGAIVGPFARLRPGARIARNAHIGNFVEIKQAEIAEGAKVNHLTYIGDASIGAGANIGAGTITCNYDGFGKYRTEIGAGAFIGSNASLVAPVKIGEGAYVGSGSVITKDVAPDALALTRAPQEERPGWAKDMRTRRAKRGGNKPT
jgi:bifunctional UDP-N-acetylglucosamine pyrophosphorylase/glucosamine-1-phosphate N-acetyltransferase